MNHFWLVLAIRDRPFIDKVCKELRGPSNGGVNLGVIHTTLLAHHDSDIGDQTGIVKRTIPRDRPWLVVGAPDRTSVTERTEEALPSGER